MIRRAAGVGAAIVMFLGITAVDPAPRGGSPDVPRATLPRGSDQLPVTPTTEAWDSPSPVASDDRSPSARTVGPLPTVRASSRPTPRPSARPGSTQTVAGTASWYLRTRGYGNRATVALPGARYVPAGSRPWGWVTVRIVDRHGRVHRGRYPVVDACGCYVGTPRARIVDLSRAAVVDLGLDPGDGTWHRATIVITRP